MTEAFRSVGVGSLLTVGGASMVLAALTLRDARRSIRLAEGRMEYLRKEQARLLDSLRKERRSLKEDLKREQDLHLEAQREVERLNRERLLWGQEQGRLVEALDLERAKRLDAERQARQEREGQEQERRARREAEQRSDQSERELQELRKARQDREAPREVSSPVAAKVSLESGLQGNRALTEGESQQAREPVQASARALAQEGWGSETRRPAGLPETAAPKPARGPKRDKKSRRAVWMPHPDDVEGGGTAEEQTRAQGDAPTEMFRRHYDKYLENYQGYLELAEGLYQMRENGEAQSGSMSGREWEERLRRVNDGIERTTARLDILEEHNPELVTDARISHRASLARRHSELNRSIRDRERS